MSGLDPKRCRATAKHTGEQCKRFPIPGGTVCRYHGGGAPQTLKAAARRREEEKAAREVARFITPINASPSEALLDLVHWTSGEVAYWRARVEEIAAENPKALTSGLTTATEETDPAGLKTTKRTVESQPHVTYRMLVDAQERLARYAAAALRAGIEERRVQLAEQQGALIAGAITRILDALNLTPTQTALIPQIVPTVLRQIGATQ